jgi:cytochrome c oxidase subunit 3
MISDVKLNYSDAVAGEKKSKKIHPHKFTMWVAIGSMIMMFAGLTSAYVVKSGQATWQEIRIPELFWYSTIAILLSSVTIRLSLRNFKAREMQKYRLLIAVTFALGVLFIVLQYLGFQQMWASGITLSGSGAGQFIYVIAGFHALHVLGGIVALLIIFIKAFIGKTKTYSSLPIEIAGTYWHFVDALWIYLMIFFILIG